MKLLRPFLLAVLAWSVVAWGAATLLVVRADLPRADAIVMLSGARAYIERAERAAQLFHAGRAPIIVLTNDGMRGAWSPARQENPLFVDLATTELQRLGVGVDHIQVLPEVLGGGTYGEALRLRQYAHAHGLKSILIVTSAYHSRRAWWTMRRVFGRSGIAVGIAVPKRGPAVFWWLYPSGWRTVGVEYVKLIYYFVRYSVPPLDSVSPASRHAVFLDIISTGSSPSCRGRPGRARMALPGLCRVRLISLKWL